MAHPSYLREKARELRRSKKLTIDELAERLSLPRTTVFCWVRDIEIPRKPLTAFPVKAYEAAARSNRRRFAALREAAYDEGELEFNHLEATPTFREFVCIFIAEGYKRCRNRVSIANSDPTVMQLATSWLRRESKNEVRFSLQYHADQDPEELCRFWGNLLGAEAGSIRLQRKSNSRNLAGRSWRSAHGVLTTEVNDTEFRARLQAWVDLIQAEWAELDSALTGCSSAW